jgi:hypothetical protein
MSIDEGLADVADVDGTVALMWPWFLLAFDDWGRAVASPRRLKAQLFPLNDVVMEDVIEAALHAFAQAGFITLYLVGDQPYMAIESEKWFTYQTQIHKAKRDNDASRYPAPDAESAAAYAESRGLAREPADSRGESRFLPPPSTLHPTPSIAESRDGAFDEFWTLYPRKVGKGAARKAFTKAVSKVGTARVRAALVAQLPDLGGREQKFIPHPATWLNQERWGDEPAPSAIPVSFESQFYFPEIPESEL